MPLRCVNEHIGEIEANTDTEKNWEEWRVRAREKLHLRMPCCLKWAELKISRLGTSFFAQKAMKKCDWKPETEGTIQSRLDAKIGALLGRETQRWGVWCPPAEI